jgi:ketosteroid isomerase-like protein
MPDRADSTNRVRQLVLDRVQAVLDRNVDLATAANADDIVTFDALPPLRNAGAGGIRERTESWFDGYSQGPGYELRDLEVVAGDDVAFAYYLYRVSGTLKNGGVVAMWVRATLGLRKLAGEWRIVHEHDSIPFDPESGRALLDIEP